jgi:hypothetical protein
VQPLLLQLGRNIALLGILGSLTAPVWGGPVPFSRSFDRKVTLTSEPIVVTADFINPETATLRGFYYADQVPSGLGVTPISVTINGQRVTNYLFESGQDGDIYPGCTPRRWIFEQPDSFLETNPVPALATVRIVYSLSTTNSGTFPLQHYAWVGYDPGSSNIVSGFGAGSGQQPLSFLTAPENLRLGLQFSNRHPVLTFSSQPDVLYAVEYTDTLSPPHWRPLAKTPGTGTVIALTDVTGLAPRRFYRLQLPTTLAPGRADLAIINQQAVLTFLTLPGVTYQVEYTDDLGAPNWQPLTTVTSTGAALTVEDPSPLVPRRFYRARLP